MKEWNGEELQEPRQKAGIPMPLARNIKDVLKMDTFTKSAGLMPLVSVEKVGEAIQYHLCVKAGAAAPSLTPRELPK